MLIDIFCSLQIALEELLAGKRTETDKSLKQSLTVSCPDGIHQLSALQPFIGKRLQDHEHEVMETNNDSILHNMTQCDTNVYSSTVSIPAYYTEQKRSERGKLKTILRKISGIPLALLYGLFCYFIMKYMILNEPLDNFILNSTNHKGDQSNLYGYNNDETYTTYTKDKNHAGSISLQFDEDFSNSTHPNYSALKLDNVFNGSNHNNDTKHLSVDYRPELIYLSSALSVTLGFASTFSRGTRCSMVLILPGLITRRSNTFLFTFIAGLLAHGPIASLGYNFNQLLENMVCMYEKVTDNVRKILKIVKDEIENLTHPDDIIVIKIEFMSNFTWKAFRDIINVPRLSEIKHQLSLIAYRMNMFGYYSTIARQIFTAISIIMLIVDAIKYLRSYYSDSSFDNMYICNNTSHLWKHKGYEQLTPLRHWELSEGYKIPGSPKVTRREFVKLFRNTLPTVLFSLFAILVMVSDYLLGKLLQYIKDKQNITISFGDVGSKLLQKLKDINISTSSCLSQPQYTPTYIYIIISFLLFVAFMSCVLEVYMSRVRAKMCNFFYSERAQERADYLHYKINAGRINRKVQLKLTVRRELERRERLKEFSPWSHFKTFCCSQSKHTNTNMICPGCGWKVLSSNARDIRFTLGEIEVNDKICHHCYLDFAENPLIRTPLNKRKKKKKRLPMLNNSSLSMDDIHGTL